MIDSLTSSCLVDCEEEEEEDGDHEERIEEKVGRHRIGTISLYTLHRLCVRCKSTWILVASIFPDPGPHQTTDSNANFKKTFGSNITNVWLYLVKSHAFLLSARLFVFFHIVFTTRLLFLRLGLILSGLAIKYLTEPD
jgi:hypothetical protein